MLKSQISPNYLSLPSCNLRKKQSFFNIGSAMINEKLLSFDFSRQKILELRPDILFRILYLYNTRLFPEEFLKDKKLKLVKSDESSADYYQSLNPKIDPSEIEIGELGNSLFISAIYALIETPIILFGLIDQIPMNKYGAIYIIFINQNGVWRELFIDEVLPCKLDPQQEDKFTSSAKKSLKKDNEKLEKQTLYFSHLKNNSANWLSLIEKAYGFVYGGYDKMLRCLLEDILYDLTAAVTETVEIKKISHFELGDRLFKDFNKGSPMLLIENDLMERLEELYNNKETCNQWGIPIIDVRNTKTEYIIVKIRTLKTFNTKKLTYNKGSNNWPPDLKAELAINFDPPNVIWLSLEEIKDMFSNLIVCNINLPNFHKSVPFEFSNYETLSFSICHIRSNESFHLGVTICQDDLREFAPSYHYRYSKIRIFIAKIQNGLKFVTSVIGQKRNVGVNIFLEKGVYLIYFEIEWQYFSNTSPSREIKLNLYSDYDCMIKIANKSIETRKNFLSNIYASISSIPSFQNNSEIKNYTKKIHENINFIYGVFSDYYYLRVKNDILIKQFYKMSIQANLMGSFYTDMSLEKKNFSDKEIKLLFHPNKDLILIFKVSNMIDLHPKITKGLKNVPKLKKNVQDYELKAFDYDIFHNLNEVIDNSFQTMFFERSDAEIRADIIKWGMRKQRIIDGKEIEVYAWTATLEEGVVYLIENYLEYGIYSEKVTFNVDNLELLVMKKKAVKYYKNYIEISLEPGKFALIKWIKQKKIPIFSYKLKSNFCIKENKFSL